VAFDLGGILADEVALQLADRGGDREAFRGERAFAEAGDALVGVDLRVDVVLVVACIDEERLHVCDLEVADVVLLLRGGEARQRSESGAGRCGKGAGEEGASVHEERVRKYC
jgi:hypothetical protein